MKVHKIIKRGLQHKDYCEDFLLYNELPNKHLLFAVFDGCSSGKDSFFASALLAKTLKKITSTVSSEPTEDLSEYFQKILYRWVVLLKETKQIIELETNEMLSTAIIFLLNMENKSGIAIALGDGLLLINNNFHEIQQNNTPDYIAYHFDEISDLQSFTNWYNRQLNIFQNQEVLEVSISTDGIFSFQKDYSLKPEINQTIENEDVIKYLLQDNFLINNPAMLARKCNMLKNSYGIANYDDLGIIRICEI